MFFYRSVQSPVIISLSTAITQPESGFAEKTVSTNQNISSSRGGNAIITLRSNYCEGNLPESSTDVTIEVLIDGNTVIVPTNPAFKGDNYYNTTPYIELTSSALPISSGEHVVTYRVHRPYSGYNRGWNVFVYQPILTIS